MWHRTLSRVAEDLAELRGIGCLGPLTCSTFLEPRNPGCVLLSGAPWSLVNTSQGKSFYWLHVWVRYFFIQVRINRVRLSDFNNRILIYHPLICCLKAIRVPVFQFLDKENNCHTQCLSKASVGEIVLGIFVWGTMYQVTPLVIPKMSEFSISKRWPRIWSYHLCPLQNDLDWIVFYLRQSAFTNGHQKRCFPVGWKTVRENITYSFAL